MDGDANAAPNFPAGAGGSGGPSNVKLAARALRQRWPMSDERRAQILDWLAQVAESSDDARARVNAGKALIEADKLNMEQEKRDLGLPDANVQVTGQMKHEHTHAVTARIEHLAGAFTGAADREEAGGLPGDGAGEPVGP